MNFETWWNLSGASVIHKEPKDAARDAWEAGIQEGIDRMYKLYDICPECMLPNGQHKMDCGRGRKSDG